MNYELSAWILIGVLLLASIILLVLRTRKRKQVKPRRQIDRVSARRATPRKEEKKLAVPDLPFYDVDRPGIFVFKNAKGQAQLLLQRAQLTDEAHFRSQTEDVAVLKAFKPIAAHVNALNIKGQTKLCSDLYSINFGKGEEQTDEQLTIQALTTHGHPMGESLKDSIPASLIVKLRELTKNTGIDRALKKAMDREYLGLEKELSRASLLFNSEKKLEWEASVSEIKAFISGENRAENDPEMNRIRSSLLELIKRLDRELATVNDSVKDLASTDAALTSAVPLIEERELTVRALFLLSILKISKNANYFSGLQSVSRLEKSAKICPGVEALLEKARHVILDLAEKSGRDMNNEELALLGQLKKEIDELRTEADASRSRLCKESAYLRAVVDDYLIHCDMSPRYAIKVNEDGEVSALMVLHRH